MLPVDAGRRQPDQVGLVGSMAAFHQPRVVLIEDAGSGTHLIRELRHGSGVQPTAVKPEHNKITRTTIALERGQVFLPARASWLDDFIDPRRQCAAWRLHSC